LSAWATIHVNRRRDVGLERERTRRSVEMEGESIRALATRASGRLGARGRRRGGGLKLGERGLDPPAARRAHRQTAEEAPDRSRVNDGADRENAEFVAAEGG
jgi:hypothetical protein